MLEIVVAHLVWLLRLLLDILREKIHRVHREAAEGMELFTRARKAPLDAVDERPRPLLAVPDHLLCIIACGDMREVRRIEILDAHLRRDVPRIVEETDRKDPRRGVLNENIILRD